MRKMLAAVAALTVFGAVAAFADTIENSFGNTIVVAGANGAGAVNYHFNADNTFSIVGPDGSAAGGTWAVAGDQLCMTPTGAAEPACVTYVGDKNVGDTWTQVGIGGGEITVTLQAGR